MSSTFAQGLVLLDAANVDGVLQTKAFLNLCTLVANVVDSLGSSFALVKHDIKGNIERLNTKATSDPEKYASLFAVIEDEVAHGQPSRSSSCTKGLLWLKRAMEFTAAILQKLLSNPQDALPALVKSAYNETLYNFHGYLTYGVFTVALSFVPSREQFLLHVNGGTGTEVPADMPVFVERFSGVLLQVHNFLDANGLNDPARV